MRLTKLLSRWRRQSPQPAPQPPRPVPVKLQTAMQDFESRLFDLQNEYVAMREAMIEHHSRDRSELARREQAGDRLDQQLAQAKAQIAVTEANLNKLRETMLETLQPMLTAIAEISATANQIAAQHSAAAAPPCDSQNLPDEPLPARSPDSGSSCLPASSSETCQDGAASGLSAAPDSDPPV